MSGNTSLAVASGFRRENCRISEQTVNLIAESSIDPRCGKQHQTENYERHNSAESIERSKVPRKQFGNTKEEQEQT
jgi:hypothetical protein